HQSCTLQGLSSACAFLSWASLVPAWAPATSRPFPSCCAERAPLDEPTSLDSLTQSGSVLSSFRRQPCRPPLYSRAPSRRHLAATSCLCRRLRWPLSRDPRPGLV